MLLSSRGLNVATVGVFRLFGRLVFSSSLICLSCSAKAEQTYSEGEALKWVSTYYNEIFEKVFRLGDSPLDALGEDTQWALRVTIRPAFEKESMLWIRKEYSGRIHAEAVTAISPVREQMFAIRKASSQGGLEDVAAAIRVRRATGTSENCPDLESITLGLQMTPLNLPPGDVLYLDPTSYDILYRTHHDELRFNFVLPESDEGEPRIAILSWIDRAIGAIQHCSEE